MGRLCESFSASWAVERGAEEERHGEVRDRDKERR